MYNPSYLCVFSLGGGSASVTAVSGGVFGGPIFGRIGHRFGYKHKKMICLTVLFGSDNFMCNVHIAANAGTINILRNYCDLPFIHLRFTKVKWIT